eukprot:scaffold22660_cov127-Cylindrotheca_fusiformis.AAC.7
MIAAVVLPLCLLVSFLKIGKSQAFSSRNGLWPHRNPFHFSLFSIPTTNSNIESKFWDFQDHRCYAEVAKPVGRGVSQLFAKESKPEVILIHGFGCSTVYWRETIRYLITAGYTVHALDLLGQGKSEKPGRAEGIQYSIDLWANMVDSYAKMANANKRDNGIVLVGNSLGSCVALAAATGDFNTTSPYIASNVKGICMFNCGIGMNSRNIIRDPAWNFVQRSLLAAAFDILDFLIFGNAAMIDFLLNKVVTQELLKDALTGLYQCAPVPDDRVDDALVDSFYYPAKDVGSVETLNQIYTNDPGKTPMEYHQDNAKLSELPIQLIWGDSDGVTPIEGSVGQFYTALAQETDSNVALRVINAGHVPFDEIPECNEVFLEWLEQIA